MAGLACMAVYSWAFAKSIDSLEQFMLILMSVAAAAIILPELPSTLWSLDADRIRILIPIRQRKRLLMELIAAEVDDPARSDLLWRKVVDPLLEASRSPWECIGDMDYDIHIHPNCLVELPEDAQQVLVTSVSIDSKSLRVLPPMSKTGGRYWVTMARTASSFQHEYTQMGCLARELLPMAGLDSASWRRLIGQLCSARMMINGEVIDLFPESVDELPDVVRWYAASAFDQPSERVQVRIMFDFVMEALAQSFIVSFLSYYCIGSTAITMKLYGSPGAELTCDAFFGRALSGRLGNGVTRTRKALFDEAVFSTGPDSILLPGSGVHFCWGQSERPDSRQVLETGTWRGTARPAEGDFVSRI
ncbi:hypothetical protein ACIA58_23460 [Kribbella sp. NPDC051586]|uniref:hypothetical protein n=1 Tax=Kribbella sp. NPDC051586 TaxID=3364118 RepID=UPI0037A8548A